MMIINCQLNLYNSSPQDTREVYSFLKKALPSEDETTDIRWNFAKFLVDHEGTPFKRFGPKTNPVDLAADIEELLARKETAAAQK